MSNNNMALKLLENENENENGISEDHQYAIIEEREELMIPPNSDGNSTLRKAHFLKPLLNPKIQSLPKSTFFPLCKNPNINFKSLSKMVSFKGRLRPLRGWKSWVDDLKQTHQLIWKKVGIFDAIMASTYNIMRDNELIMCLAERWNPETNTFVFPWGESTITLEDIMILGGFPVLGASPVLTHLVKNNKYAEIEVNLYKYYSEISSSKIVSHYGWMDCYKGMGGEIEHVAFLVFWLSRYVYSINFYGRINYNVIDIAISLSMGIKIALAPTILASIYRDLALLREKIVFCNMEGVHDDGSELVVWALFQLVQLWAWERFQELSPNPVSLAQGEPRVARWHEVRKVKTRNLRLDNESVAESFIWRPYVLCLKNWVFPKFYSDDGMWLVLDSEVDEELLSFVRCLRASELVSSDCVMQYLPNRVGLQFGMDQDIPDFVPRSNADLELAWSSYAKPLDGMKLYLPPRLFEGDVTVEYSKWWRPLDLDSKLITYARRKRRRRKVKKLSQLLEEDSSSFQGMTFQMPLNLVNEVESNANLIGLEDTRMNGEEDTRMCAYISVEEDERQKEKGSYPITIGGSKGSQNSHSQNAESSMAVYEAGNEQEAPTITPETKRLCSEIDKDSDLGKDDAEVVIKQTNIIALPDDVEEGNISGSNLRERCLEIESRIGMLESIVSIYKAAKFGS